jgi:hypothetical protein
MPLSSALPACRHIAMAIAVLGAAASAAAQDRLFVGPSELGAFGRFGQRLAAAPGATANGLSPVHGQFVAGGRYVVTIEPIALFTTVARVYDTGTGLVTQELNGTLLAVDPAGPHVFMLDGAVVSDHDLDRRTSRPLITAEQWDLPEFPFGNLVLGAYASAAGELFVNRRVPGGTGPEIAVVRVRDGAIVRTLPAADPTQPMTRWLASPDGRRLWAVETFRPGRPYYALALVDGVTGARVASRPLQSPALVRDERFGRIYAVGKTLEVYDDDLTPLAALPMRDSCGQPNLAVSPHTGRTYVLESEGGGGSSTAPRIPITYYLSVFDGASGRRLDTRIVTGEVGPANTSDCRGLPVTVLTAPLPPRTVTAAVSGRDVTLAWTNAGDASDIVLDVGVAPGRTDLTLSVGSSSPITIANAPPGTYYLRVRGTNAFGVSQPSNEVAITIP